MPKPAWTWADYAREKRKAERKAPALPASRNRPPPRPVPAIAAPDAPAKIDLSAAPSSMERLAESWKGRK